MKHEEYTWHKCSSYLRMNCFVCCDGRGLYRVDKNTRQQLDIGMTVNCTKHHIDVSATTNERSLHKAGAFLRKISILLLKLRSTEQHDTSPYVSFIFISHAKEQWELEEVKIGKYLFIVLPSNSTLWMILYLFLYYIHYNTFRPVIAVIIRQCYNTAWFKKMDSLRKSLWLEQ